MTKIRFSEIDDSNRDDHTFLSESDKCYFLYEYTSGKRYDFSSTNQLVTNLKISPVHKGGTRWRYKTNALKKCAEDFTEALNADWLRTGTLVPIPPSKSKTHPEYDDRMLQICRAMRPGFVIDVRELVVQAMDLVPFHTGSRLSVDDLVRNYAINREYLEPEPTHILLVDDVLTVGTHFKAMQRVLLQAFPSAKIAGAFVARRVFPNPFDTVEE